MFFKRNRAIFFGICLGIFPLTIHAQNFPDSVNLPVVEIGAKANQNTGIKIVQTDSLTLAINRNNSLSEMLSRSSNIFIKNYGPGALALPGFRGTTAGHTKLYWNGLPLSSPMLGVADLNLVPVFAVDGVEIQYGNAGLQQGSGGFGGNILLNSSVKKRNILEAEILQNMGSFGLQQTQFKSLYGKKIVAGTRAFHQKAENKFPFENTAKPNKPVEFQRHASNRQYGFVQTLDGEIKGRILFSAALWHQQTEKQLPPLLTTANNRESQQDEATRATFRLKKYKEKMSLFLDAGYSMEKLNYENIIADIYSKSVFQRAYLYPHFRLHKMRNFLLDGGLQIIADQATSPKYNNKDQQRISLPIQLQYSPKKHINLSLLLRPETVSFKENTLSFSGSLNYDLLKNNLLNLYSNFGRNFNYPTLNDLYWHPGGNPDLVAENALSSEAGFRNNIESKTKKIKLENSLTFYTTTIDNYIQWQQGSQGFWQPQNLKKVWARGAEISSKFNYKFSKNNLLVNANYSFVRSTSQRAMHDLDETVGRQLFYIPAHTMQTSLAFSRGKSIFSAQHIYTHFRYTPTSFLEAYGLVNLQVESGFILKRTALRTYLKCNNFLNRSYQAIAWRPMPGRWFEIGLSIKFTKAI